MKVLVVDDSPTIRSRIVALLREVPGVEATEADGGQEAIERVRASAFDVVVLDLHMPGRSGLDVLPEIKAEPRPPRVIVFTSHPTELHRRQCLALGADHFLDKSREFQQLVDVLVRPTGARS